jgi:hypothetical protein
MSRCSSRLRSAMKSRASARTCAEAPRRPHQRATSGSLALSDARATRKSLSLAKRSSRRQVSSMGGYSNSVVVPGSPRWAVMQLSRLEGHREGNSTACGRGLA